MSIEIEYSLDRDLRIDSNGISITREKMYCATDIFELFHSGFLPMRKSAHPRDARLRLNSYDVSEAGTKGALKQFLWKGQYASNNSSFADHALTDGSDPWDLGALNVQMQTYSEKKNMEVAFFKDKKPEALKNTAKSPVKKEHDVYGITFSFEFASKKEPTVNTYPVINNQTVTVAGREISQYCGLLLPMTYTPIVEKDDQGNVTKRYYNVSAKIKIVTAEGKSWEQYINSAGTLAIPRNSEQKIAQPLYTYSDPDNADFEIVEIKIKKKIGTLDEVIAAKRKYANKKTVEKYGAGWDKQSNPTKRAEAQQFWEQKNKELAWEEVKEPIFLDAEGYVDLELFENKNDNTKEPIKIYFFEYPLSDWKQYNLPKKAEGF